MEALFPGASGERDLGQTAVVAAESMDLPARVGIAGNKLAARIAASLTRFFISAPENPGVPDAILSRSTSSPD